MASAKSSQSLFLKHLFLCKQIQVNGDLRAVEMKEIRNSD